MGRFPRLTLLWADGGYARAVGSLGGVDRELDPGDREAIG